MVPFRNMKDEGRRALGDGGAIASGERGLARDPPPHAPSARRLASTRVPASVSLEQVGADNTSLPLVAERI